VLKGGVGGDLDEAVEEGHEEGGEVLVAAEGGELVLTGGGVLGFAGGGVRYEREEEVKDVEEASGLAGVGLVAEEGEDGAAGVAVVPFLRGKVKRERRNIAEDGGQDGHECFGLVYAMELTVVGERHVCKNIR
jgi:hypothetical protein